MKLTYEAPEMKIYVFSTKSTILASEPYTENPIEQGTAHSLGDFDPFGGGEE